jgi:regulator of protease activity HflC (stomatin/prohibitin superfamily)
MMMVMMIMTMIIIIIIIIIIIGSIFTVASDENSVLTGFSHVTASRKTSTPAPEPVIVALGCNLHYQTLH